MSNIYFIADTHFGHKNIASVNGSNWDKGHRPYGSLHEMNKDLIEGINKTVGQDDTLYHIGDWSFGGVENIWNFRKRLICNNIHLILGNHDHHIENDRIIQIPDEDRDLCFNRFGGFSTIKAGDLFSSVSYVREITINGKKFFLSHYAHRVWPGSHKGVYHLYGHSHDSLDIVDNWGTPNFWGRSMDCGIESAIRILGEARPFSLTDITNILDERPVKFVDHHERSTNI